MRVRALLRMRQHVLLQEVQLWLPDALEPVASEWEGAVWRDLFSEGGADSSV